MATRIEIDGPAVPVEDADFPLSVGGAGCDVELDLPDAEPYAWIGRSGDDPFVQPARPGVRVTRNGDRVDNAQWLRDGDRIGIEDASIVVEIAGGRIRIRSDSRGVRSPAPPTTAPSTPGGEPPPRLVRAVEFRPRSARDPSRGRRSWRPLTVLTWISLGMLALAAWFVLTARSVEIQVEPTPDRVTVRGTLPTIPIGGRLLARPGHYKVEASRDGYRPLAVDLVLESGGPDRFEFVLEKLPGFLTVRATGVESAEVVVDDRPVGLVPLDAPLELAPGSHDVRVRAPRHAAWTGTVEIEGSGSRVDLDVTLVPRWAEVTFRSRPAEAAVTLDGAPAGRTPLVVDVGEGRHRVRIERAGFEPYDGRLDVVANEPFVHPTVDLVPKVGFAEVSSVPGGATVTVDGAYRGTTPIRLPLAPGREHAVGIALAGHVTATRTVQVSSDETRPVAVTLEPRIGEVRVQARPAGAEILIDGEPAGRGSMTVTLSATPHRIEIRMDGYVSHSETVTPRPGIPTEVEVELKTAAEIRAASIPGSLTSTEGHELIRFEGGRFRMGAARREPGRRANESLRDVEITRPFYLGTAEVTNAQFRRFREAHRSGAFSGHNLEVDTHPVVQVTWNDAARYCNWLSDREKLPRAYRESDGRLIPIDPPTTGYRLPTEAEWAFAARFAGRTVALKFPWGDRLPPAPGSGNFADGSAVGALPETLEGYQDRYPATAPVDAFGPDDRGLHQMGGNVAEWVQDVYTIAPSRSGTLEVDPAGPAEGSLHTIRGSSWMDATVSELRLSYRDYGDDPRPDVGFRIARFWKVPEGEVAE